MSFERQAGYREEEEEEDKSAFIVRMILGSIFMVSRNGTNK